MSEHEFGLIFFGFLIGASLGASTALGWAVRYLRRNL